VTGSGGSLRHEKVLNGGTEKTEQTFEEPVKAGEEKVTIDGKEYACGVWKSKGRDMLDLADTELLFAEGIDAPLRIRSPKAETRPQVEFTAVALKEKIAFGEDSFECVKLEGTIEARQGPVKMTLWMTPKVPGGTPGWSSSRAGGRRR
jgi:hypothetical protein